ncbi:MAG: sodium/substrate symporter small subunit [Bacteroidota bacterium]
MTNHEQYEVNFFKPLSDHAKANKKLISTLAIIWAVAVFGFHFLLIFITTPTPEQTLSDFNSVWPQVAEDTSATIEMKQVFAKSLLMVLGKNIAVKENHKTVLKESLSWTVFSMQADSVKPLYQSEPNDEVINSAAVSIGLKSEGFDKIMKDLLPTSLIKVEKTSISNESKKALPEIMELYLIHNQSFLTDFKFLGFPFHYWYTAQFLLILFVLLCLYYAFAIEKMNKKYEFVEET